MNATILLIDDETAVIESLGEILTCAQYEVVTCEDSARALELVRKRFFPVVITDLRMPGMDGLALAGKLRELSPDSSVILMTAYASLENAVAAFRHGVRDYLVKPVIAEDLCAKVATLLRWQRTEDENRMLRAGEETWTLVGRSPALRRLADQAAKVAPTDATVLITGESGTGKELVARMVHRQSRRAGESFMGVNCGAIPGSLLESELFGHLKGSFTGADRHREGLFVRLSRGTLFLDEISTMPLDLQAKLLRVLELREVLPLGADSPVKIETRVLAASNVDLKTLVAQGRFREDLYYRLNVVPLVVPPLRERPEDIAVLADHFFEREARRLSRSKPELSSDALELLNNYHWKGNVRELRNIIERTLILCDHDVITPLELPQEICAQNDADTADPRGTLKIATAAFQRDYITRALSEVRGSKKEAARRLGISAVTLWRYQQDLGIEG